MRFSTSKANIYDDAQREARASAIVLGAGALAVLGVLAIVALTAGCSTLPRVDWPAVLTNAAPPAVTNAIPPATSGATNAQPSGDAIDLAGVRFAYSSARVVAQASSTRIAGGKIGWTDNRPATWPRKTVKVTVDGISCAAIIRDGRVIVAGKWDWTRPNQRSKGIGHMVEGYGVFKGETLLRKGDLVSVCVVSVDGRERTTWSEPAEYR